MSKHTSGAWTRQVIAPHFESVSIRANGTVIARTYHSTGHDGRANACLIAAAPELLEALRDLLTTNERLPYGGLLVEPMSAARAAIARAEGRAETS